MLSFYLHFLHVSVYLSISAWVFSSAAAFISVGLLGRDEDNKGEQ